MAMAVMAAKVAAAMAEEDAVEGVTALVPTAVLKAEENVVTAEAATVAVVTEQAPQAKAVRAASSLESQVVARKEADAMAVGAWGAAGQVAAATVGAETAAASKVEADWVDASVEEVALAVSP